ncbi:aromatic ring-opening dioxygenase LigA [Streptomyces cellostaticus]|uniref:Aromatic ring-opening dioxygenase LigA n=1 Tax=Streptomyces cellostaticus TaxID=67285 RepID=A0A101NMS7_9ACTN|nr:hypothetical protein [Streptomyces cellostaticus]KUM96145.1 aromatic ring-opening dioxygenase LigA [Streptomyces cellostaticus]GHI02463.1 hypothetical protein Scel_07840 [Streptomyces cellostaticus]
MAGQEFGHHLGLPRALSGLPLSPLVPGYGVLAAAQHAAGLRHLGEIVGPSPAGLRVLDGLYVPAGPRGRRRVDGLFLDGLAQGAGPAAALAARLAALHRSDPQALRRIVLYQLIGLLQDRPAAQRARFAAELGVHADEVAGLVAAARLRPALDRRGRDAAESLAEAWERRRLHRLRGLLDRLPADGGDPALTALRTELAERLGVVEDALRSARRAEERGDREAASSAYLTALGEAADDRRALGGLVRVHRPGSGHRPLLAAELRPDHVELTWQDPDGPPSDWRLLRLYRTDRGRPAVRSVSGADPTPAGTVRDKEAALGSTVRYAALPLRDGRVAGPPLVSRRLLVAPEVGRPALTDGPGRIDGTWQRPAGADEVTVERTGDTGQVGTRADGFTVTGLPAGTHTFRIVCHYRAPDGSRVGSPGVSVTGTVHPWPEPVGTLTARPEGGAVRFAWTGGRGAEVRLVVWPGRAPAPGTELRTEDLPPRLDWPRQAGALCPPPGTCAEVTAVAVLGARALAGPGVAVEAVHAVPGLGAHRLPDGQAQVTLDWPEGAGHLVVSWDAPGGEVAAGERTLTAHAYRRSGLRLPVGPGAVRIRAATVPRVPGAVVVVPDAAETLLPPDAAVSYHLVRASSRRFLGRGRTLLRVTLSASGALGDVPEFVCVARSGTLRPRSAADGTTVLRVPGPDLARHGTVERELPASPCPTPYTLRGFLLGEHAALVRLEEPSLASLVVR